MGLYTIKPKDGNTSQPKRRVQRATYTPVDAAAREQARFELLANAVGERERLKQEAAAAPATINQAMDEGMMVAEPDPIPVVRGAARRPIGSDTISGVDEETRTDVSLSSDALAAEQRQRAGQIASAREAVARRGLDMVERQRVIAKDGVADTTDALGDAEDAYKISAKRAEVSSKLKATAVERGIDVDRLTKKMPASRKAMNMIAIALEGLGKAFIRYGGGQVSSESQVLKMIQASIDADIAAQKQDIVNILRSSGLDQQELKRAELYLDKSKKDDAAAAMELHKLNLLEIGYRSTDPESRKFVLDMVTAIENKKIATKIQVAPRLKKKRLVFKKAGATSAGGKVQVSVPEKTVKAAQGAGASAYNPRTHTIVDGKPHRNPSGFVRMTTYKDGKTLRIRSPGKLKIGKRMITIGHKDMKLSDMRDLAAVDKKSFSGTIRVLESMAETLQDAIAHNKKNWRGVDYVWSHIAVSSKDRWKKIRNAAHAVKKAVDDSGGRATDLENAIIKALLISAGDGYEMGFRKMRQALGDAERKLEARISGYNFQTTKIKRVMALHLMLKRVKSLIPREGGGTARKLKTVEGN